MARRDTRQVRHSIETGCEEGPVSKVATPMVGSFDDTMVELIEHKGCLEFDDFASLKKGKRG